METPCRELSEDVSFGVGTLLVVEHSRLEKPPESGVASSGLHTGV